MVHPSPDEVTRLNLVAQEVVSMLEADGYTVGEATAQHHAFKVRRGTGRALERDLVTLAARRGAKSASMSIIPTSGGGLDLCSIDGTIERFYRVKRAELDKNGGYRVVVGAGSSLVAPPPDQGTLLAKERWVVGWVTDDTDHIIVDVFAGRIVGHHGNSVLYLELDDLISLMPSPSHDGFDPSDDLDLDFGDDDDLDLGGEASA